MRVHGFSSVCTRIFASCVSKLRARCLFNFVRLTRISLVSVGRPSETVCLAGLMRALPTEVASIIYNLVYMYRAVVLGCAVARVWKNGNSSSSRA